MTKYSRKKVNHVTTDDSNYDAFADIVARGRKPGWLTFQVQYDDKFYRVHTYVTEGRSN